MERDIYTETLKAERNNSTILNPANRTGFNAFFFDEGYIKGLILELEGSQDPEIPEKQKGKYFSGSTWKIAVIPLAVCLVMAFAFGCLFICWT